jgi:hypothetical protein
MMRAFTRNVIKSALALGFAATMATSAIVPAKASVATYAASTTVSLGSVGLVRGAEGALNNLICS